MRALVLLLLCGTAAAQPAPAPPTFEVARTLGGDADLGARNLARINTGGSRIGTVNIGVFSRVARQNERARNGYAQQRQPGRPTPSGRM